MWHERCRLSIGGGELSFLVEDFRHCVKNQGEFPVIFPMVLSSLIDIGKNDLICHQRDKVTS